MLIRTSFNLSPNCGEPRLGDPISVIICQLKPSDFFLKKNCATLMRFVKSETVRTYSFTGIMPTPKNTLLRLHSKQFYKQLTITFHQFLRRYFNSEKVKTR